MAQEPLVYRPKSGFRRACGRKWDVPSAAGFGNCLQGLFLQFHLHCLALELLLAASVRGRKGGFAPWVAYAHGEDGNAALPGELRVVDGLAAQVAAVGYKDYGVVVVGGRVERVQRRAYRRAEVGFAARSRLGRELFQRAAQVGAVRGEGADAHSCAPERDKRAPVSVQRVDEVGDVGLYALKAVGPYVLRKHRPRHVYRHDHVPAAGRRLLGGPSPLRPCRGEDAQEEARENQPRLQSPQVRASGHELRPQRRRDEPPQRLFAARAEKRPPQADERNHRRKGQKHWIREFHFVPAE